MQLITKEQVNTITQYTNIPEVVYRETSFYWSMVKKSPPVEPFIVCEYESFNNLCNHLKRKIEHVICSVKGVKYIAFEGKSVIKN